MACLLSLGVCVVLVVVNYFGNVIIIAGAYRFRSIFQTLQYFNFQVLVRDSIFVNKHLFTYKRMFTRTHTCISATSQFCLTEEKAN